MIANFLSPREHAEKLKALGMNCYSYLNNCRETVISTFSHILQLKSPINHLKLSVVSHIQKIHVAAFVLKIWMHIYEFHLFCFGFFYLFSASGTVFTAIDVATGQEVSDWESQKRLQIEQRSGTLLIKLNKHAAFTLSPLGRHQTDQSSKAAQKGAHHQWDSSDEGAEEPQHCQLFRQVKQRQPADPLWKVPVSHCWYVCVSVSWWGRSSLWWWSIWLAGRWRTWWQRRAWMKHRLLLSAER